MFKGSLIALATPFDADNRIDYKALEKLIEFHVSEGSNGLVIAGDAIITWFDNSVVLVDEEIAEGNACFSSQQFQVLFLNRRTCGKDKAAFSCVSVIECPILSQNGTPFLSEALHHQMRT